MQLAQGIQGFVFHQLAKGERGRSLGLPRFFFLVVVMLAELGVVHCSVKFTDAELETLRADTFGSQDCIDVD